MQNINDGAVAELIKTWQPDIVIDFGTGKVGLDILNLLPNKILNLHGGDPEHYRGLDTHMWAMYHNDFAALVTTLHCLNADLDDGNLIETSPIPLFQGMKIHEFRRANTQVCIDMICDFLKAYAQTGMIDSRPQKRKGRYYSFMPTVLKNIAARNFEKHTKEL